MLQQHLPFTVLKLKYAPACSSVSYLVATAPTVYGIETIPDTGRLETLTCAVATAPTVYGIETLSNHTR